MPGSHGLDVDNPIGVPGTAPAGRPVRLLSRKPKALDTAPSLYQNGRPSTAAASTSAEESSRGARSPRTGETSTVTADVAQRRDLDEVLRDATTDIALTHMVRQISARLSIRRRPRRAAAQRGAGNLAPMPYGYRSDDIDLDRTIDVITATPVLEDTDIVVRERLRSRRAVCLILDVSGSMKGEKARMAVATVAALAGELVDDQLAVVAFWSDAALVKPLSTPMSTVAIVDRVLRLPAKGLTNVEFALQIAHGELRTSVTRRRTAVLLSDALHNAGPDPRDTAARFPELHVLLQTDGSHDRALGAEIAGRGRGRLESVRTHRDVAPALNRLLAD